MQTTLGEKVRAAFEREPIAFCLTAFILLTGAATGMTARHILTAIPSSGSVTLGTSTGVEGTATALLRSDAKFGVTGILPAANGGFGTSNNALLGPLLLNNAANVSAPDLAWSAETGTGWRRQAAGDIRFGVSGADSLWLGASQLGIGQAPGATVGLQVKTAGGWSSANVGRNIIASPNVSNPAIGIQDSGGTNNWALINAAGTLQFSQMPALTDGATAPTLKASIATAGFTIGSSGTPVKQHVVGTTTWNPGTITAGGGTSSATITMTGIAASNPCYAGVYDPAPISGHNVQCITTANTCTLMIRCQQATNCTLGSATFYCVVDVL